MEEYIGRNALLQEIANLKSHLGTMMIMDLEQNKRDTMVQPQWKICVSNKHQQQMQLKLYTVSGSCTETEVELVINVELHRKMFGIMIIGKIIVVIVVRI